MTADTGTVWRCGAATLVASGTLRRNLDQAGSSAQVVERNCRYLLLFFGLSRKTLPSYDILSGRWCDDGSESQLWDGIQDPNIMWNKDEFLAFEDYHMDLSQSLEDDLHEQPSSGKM